MNCQPEKKDENLYVGLDEREKKKMFQQDTKSFNL